MLIDWTIDFDRWFDRLNDRADAGDLDAQLQVDLVNAELEVLEDLQEPPTQDTPTLRTVRQSGRYQVWRVSHPFINGHAIRLIVWFRPGVEPEAVIVLFGADKAAMGDVFYDSVGSRADAAIDGFTFQTRQEKEVPDEPTD